ncbi:MAG: BLUF domain-containing protein [Caulobacteraceae bacterium]|nr:BLUF domain-containing protein [Caulobacteraceae bacterium]
MPFKLQRVVYTSRGAPASLSLLGVAEILGEAKRNNDQRDITGALAVGETHFFQVLEGPGYALDMLMRRLEQDIRHSDIRILVREGVAERAHAGWSMRGPLSSTLISRLVADVVSGRLSAEAAAAALGEGTSPSTAATPRLS